jgi:hypothetical protein
MRNFLLLFLLLMPVIGSCTDDYDDSAAWKDIDGIYKDLDQLKEKLNSLQLQANALSQIVKGGAITSVTEAANGGYVISYKGSDNVEHSFTIATTDQMVSSPIIGIQEEAGTYYWTTTTKGQTTFLLDTNKQKIPVSGSAPQIRVDENGYWFIKWPATRENTNKNTGQNCSTYSFTIPKNRAIPLCEESPGFYYCSARIAISWGIQVLA